jgi:tagatose 1,6-diphosphate aldolase
LPSLDALTEWTPARARAVDTIAGPDGVIVGAAVDHRDALRVVLARKNLDVSDAEVSALKVCVARALAPHASTMLLDAEFSAAQAVAAGALPGDTALVIPLEANGYGEASTAASTRLLEGWSAAKAAALGASGCKLLLPYRVDRVEHARGQEQVVRAAVRDCHEAGVALVLEPIVYEASGEAFGDLVVEGARRLATLGPDILKVQYPGSAAACRRLDKACGPRVPWVLLGAGASGDALATQIQRACEAGASGFIVGRTLFADALSRDLETTASELRDVSVPLLQKLATVAKRHATPWRKRVGPLAQPPLGWYR